MNILLLKIFIGIGKIFFNTVHVEVDRENDTVKYILFTNNIPEKD